MKFYGIRYAKKFRYGTKETVFRTQKGNHEMIPNFLFSTIWRSVVAGGQQGPIIAALGADVTVFDNRKSN